jgi:hypothetical protein
MEEFTANLVKVLSKKYSTNIFNLDSLYDYCGVEFNKVVKLIDEYEFNIDDFYLISSRTNFENYPSVIKIDKKYQLSTHHEIFLTLSKLIEKLFANIISKHLLVSLGMYMLEIFNERAKVDDPTIIIHIKCPSVEIPYRPCVFISKPHVLNHNVIEQKNYCEIFSEFIRYTYPDNYLYLNCEYLFEKCEPMFKNLIDETRIFVDEFDPENPYSAIHGFKYYSFPKLAKIIKDYRQRIFTNDLVIYSGNLALFIFHIIHKKHGIRINSIVH